jgi:hypothetical protein
MLVGIRFILSWLPLVTMGKYDFIVLVDTLLR